MSTKLRLKVKSVLRHCLKEKQLIFFAFLVTLFLSIGLVYSLKAGHYANFMAINGTFQNFNPIRRFFSGQIPYKDFQDYLGMGHLYLGSICTWILGGSYRDSLIAFSFLTFISFGLIMAVISYAIFRKKCVSILFTNLISIILITQPFFYKNVLATSDDILNALNASLSTGNSARYVRGMILPICCAFFILGFWIFNKFLANNEKIMKFRYIIAICVTGVIAGLAFIWSNDYGIASWLCISIMLCVIIYSRTKKVIVAISGVLLEMLISVCSIVLFVEILTFGHLGSWVNATFGTGSYQKWYYGIINNDIDKSHYLYEVDFSYLMLIQMILCIVYIVKIYMHRGSKYAIIRYGTLAFSNMVCFCAVNEYKIMSGGGESRQVALAVMFATVFFECMNLISQLFDIKKHMKRNIVIGVLIVCFAWIFSTIKEEAIFHIFTEKEGIYVKEMDGNLTSLGEDLLRTSEFLNGDSFFATYASAQELVCNQFQPSGTDYIIHVLGDEQREKYLEAFNTGDFKYAATIKETYTEWEYWIQRANWFFYRELYAKWHPVHSNMYEMYWERNENNTDNIIESDIQVSVEDIDESSKKIVIHTDESVNGFADLFINYSVRKEDEYSSLLAFHTELCSINSGNIFANNSRYESNYLRSQGEEYIPVTIVNGYGEVTIASEPRNDTFLELYETECRQIFTAPFSYIETKEIHYDNNVISINIEKSKKNIAIFNSSVKIEIGDTIFDVLDVNLNEDSISINISAERVDKELLESKLQYNNFVKVVN